MALVVMAPGVAKADQFSIGAFGFESEPSRRPPAFTAWNFSDGFGGVYGAAFENLWVTTKGTVGTYGIAATPVGDSRSTGAFCYGGTCYNSSNASAPVWFTSARLDGRLAAPSTGPLLVMDINGTLVEVTDLTIWANPLVPEAGSSYLDPASAFA